MPDNVLTFFQPQKYQGKERNGIRDFMPASVSERINARTVDKMSRVAFPVSFVLFNLFYWTFYFLVEHRLDDGHQ